MHLQFKDDCLDILIKEVDAKGNHIVTVRGDIDHTPIQDTSDPMPAASALHHVSGILEKYAAVLQIERMMHIIQGLKAGKQ